MKLPLPCADRGVPPGIGAGVYSSSPWETSFLALTEDAGWKSPYGQFFLKWYSEKLIKCAPDSSGPHAGDLSTGVQSYFRRASEPSQRL